jgi:hypothetical protein
MVVYIYLYVRMMVVACKHFRKNSKLKPHEQTFNHYPFLAMTMPHEQTLGLECSKLKPHEQTI